MRSQTASHHPENGDLQLLPAQRLWHHLIYAVGDATHLKASMYKGAITACSLVNYGMSNLELASVVETLGRCRRVIMLSSLVVVAMAAAKAAVALLSGSVGLLAQAVEAFTDLLSASMVYMGLWLAQRPPSQRFPYGYLKAETMASLIVAVFILLSGLGVLWEAVHRILNPAGLQYAEFAVGVAASSIPIHVALSIYLKRVGRETRCDAVHGTGRNYEMDAYSSCVVLLGILSALLGLPWAEPIIGFVIGLLIIKGSVEIAHSSALTLMDAVPHPERLEDIRKLVTPLRGVRGVHAIKVRRAGPFCFGEMHLEVDGEVTVDQAHRLTEEVERRVQETFPQIQEFIVHVEPAKRTRFLIALPVDGPNATPDSTPALHFGLCSHFLLAEVEEGNITKWKVVKNLASQLERKRGLATAKFLIEQGVDTVLVEEIGETPLSILRNSLISVRLLDLSKTCAENVNAFLTGILPHAIAAPHPQRHRKQETSQGTGLQSQPSSSRLPKPKTELEHTEAEENPEE